MDTALWCWVGVNSLRLWYVRLKHLNDEVLITLCVNHPHLFHYQRPPTDAKKNTMPKPSIFAKLQDSVTGVIFGKDEGTSECTEQVAKPAIKLRIWRWILAWRTYSLWTVFDFQSAFHCVALLQLISNFTYLWPVNFAAKSNFYDLTDKDMSGNDVSMSTFKGAVLCVVNVASKWGLTKANYVQFSKLYDEYNEKGLKILAFPCNQFGGQEPVRILCFGSIFCVSNLAILTMLDFTL